MAKELHGQSLDETVEFWIGRDEDGFWIARGLDGREGGLFVSREEALKYVQTVRLRRHGVVIAAPKPLSLWQ